VGNLGARSLETQVNFAETGRRDAFVSSEKSRESDSFEKLMFRAAPGGALRLSCQAVGKGRGNASLITIVN